MTTVCMEQNLMVVNNLKHCEKYFKSNLTYRKRNNWISEIDVCIASYKILNCIQSFNVNNDLNLPSDHAPIAVALSPTLVDRAALAVRAGALGDHATLYSRCQQKSKVKCPIKLCNINIENLTE